MRINELLTETVGEQQDIVKMAKKIMAWYKKIVVSFEDVAKKQNELKAQLQASKAQLQASQQSIDDADSYGSALSKYIQARSDQQDFESQYKINTDLSLTSVVGKQYTSESTLNWLKTKPIIEFTTQKYPVPRTFENATGWFSYYDNKIVIKLPDYASAKFSNTSTVERMFSTIIHELQHAIDYYKSNSLVAISSKLGRGGSTTRARQEIADINTIVAAFRKQRSRISRFPKSGRYVRDFINPEMLQSTIFKTLATDPEFSNIQLMSHHQYLSKLNTDDGFDDPSTTPVGQLFDGIAYNFGEMHDSDFFQYLQGSLKQYREMSYESKSGYVNQYKNYDKEYSNYLSKNIEINARIIQAFHMIVERLRAAKFKGFSTDPEIRKSQNDIIQEYIKDAYIYNRISSHLWPASTSQHIRNERWKRLKARTYQYIRAQFPKVSDAIPISRNMIKTSQDYDNAFMARLFGMIDKNTLDKYKITK